MLTHPKLLSLLATLSVVSGGYLGLLAQDALIPDSDYDGFSDQVEAMKGSDPFDWQSTPESAWADPSACADGVDNDRDGLVDDLDADCVDRDGDGIEDVLEIQLGSDPSDAGSWPESLELDLMTRTFYWGPYSTCTDRDDEDLDGATDELDPGCEGTPPAPPNDDFADAMVVTELPFSDAQSTVNAWWMAEASACVPIYRTIWYRFTPAADTFLSVSSSGDFGVVLAVYSGPGPSALSLIACDRGSSMGSRVEFRAVAGVTYHIQAGGRETDLFYAADGFLYYQSDCGSLTLNIEKKRLPDLRIEALSNPPASASRGGNFAVTSTVANRGETSASPSAVRFYLSADATRGPDDIVVTGYRSVPSLAPGGTSSGSTRLTVPKSTPRGKYFLLAEADGNQSVQEIDESNNAKASSTQLTVK